MSKGIRRDWFLISIGFILVLNVGFVLGANIIDKALSPIGNLDLGATYNKYQMTIDAIMYFALFITLSKATLGKVPLFKDSNTVPVIIGIMLAISMVITANKMHLVILRDIGPIALLIVAGGFGILLYNFIKGLSMDEVLAAAIAILIVSIISKFASSPVLIGAGSGSSKAMAGFSQYSSLLLLLLFPIGIVRQGKKLGLNVGNPSSSERRDERTFFPKQTDAIEKIEGIEKGLEKGISSDNPGEKDLLKTEEELEKFDEYGNVLEAQAAKFTTQLEELKKIEGDGEQKEAAMLTALSTYGTNIDSTLSKINSVEVLDQAGKHYIAQNIQGIANVCSQIVENQKQIQIKRKDTMSNLLVEDVKKIDDVLKKFKLIDQSLMNIEKNISKDISTSLIKEIENSIKTQEKTLKMLMGRLNSDKISDAQRQSMGPGIADLRNAIDEKKKELDIIKGLNGNIKNLTDTLYTQLNEVKNVLNDMDIARKKLDTQTQNNVKALANFDKALGQMEGASEKLKHDMLQVGEQAKLAEEIPIRATEGVATIFNTMISIKPENLGLQPMMKEYYLKDVIPSIQDVKMLIQKSNVLDKLITIIQTSITNLDKIYTQLSNTANKIIGKSKIDENNSKNITAAMDYVTKMVASEQSTRLNVANNVTTTLDKIVSSINAEISNIDVEMNKLQNAEKGVLNQLSKALSIIIKNKSRVSDEFKKEANNFNQNMAQATQKINEGRKI